MERTTLAELEQAKQYDLLDMTAYAEEMRPAIESVQRMMPDKNVATLWATNVLTGRQMLIAQQWTN